MRIRFVPEKHIQNLISKKYYKNLVLIRDLIERSCDGYFSKLGAPKIDLYLFTNCASSPIALGSDSEPIRFRLGDGKSYFLADSSQFGMEPLLLNSFNLVYCYLPSFRGEDPDERHLNQFYHCEAELKGDYFKAMVIAENLVKYLTKSVVEGYKEGKFRFIEAVSIEDLERVVKNKFPRVSFEEAVNLLKAKGYGKFIEYQKFGRILTNKAERMITKLVGENKIPVWVTNYDRDVVAFYQRSDPKDHTKVLNADLLAPPLKDDSFGGEIIGLGQRQDNAKEMVESMRRQGIQNIKSYKWYIDLRKYEKYQSTSGFGMGIERYIAWILGLNSLVDACIYPVIKGGFFY